MIRKNIGKQGGRIWANNNSGYIRSLAWKSVKSSRMRNVFVILTIVLSVSLLMVMALFYAGINTATKRQVESMQHVIYYGLSGEQLSEMASDNEPSSYVLGMKQGQSAEIDGKMVSPVAYGAKPLKDEGIEINTVKTTKGYMPEEESEIVLSDAYCNQAGIAPEPGEKVSFTWLDGTTEEYTVSGVYHTEENQRVYTVIFSEAYAENGSQLKDVPWQGIVCLKDAENMTQQEFEDAAYEFGSKFGVERHDVNVNNYFVDTLPGGERQAQETATIVGVGIGILLVSVLVIYSVFYLSVVGRIRQFGQLRTIGMTKRQVRRMVRLEGLILSAAGIPAGIAVGGVISYFIRPSGWSWMNMLMISICVAAADVITVLCSVRRPAKIAASISPIEAAKYSGYGKNENSGKQKKSRKLTRSITPGSLAVMSSFRNKRKTALTLISLGIGGVLYMLAGFMVSSTDQEAYARSGDFAYGEFILDYSYNLVEAAEHGEMEIRVEHPLDDTLTDEIEAIDGVEQVTTAEMIPAHWEAHGDDDTADIGILTKERIPGLLELEHKGDISYEEMLENDGIITTDGGHWEVVYGWSMESGDEVTLRWYDGKEERQKTFTISAVVDVDDFIRAQEAQYGDVSVSFLLPDTVVREMAGETDLSESLVIRTDADKTEQVEDDLNRILEKYPWLSLSTLEEEMLYVESMFTFTFSILVGLSLFIIVFALLNLLNTLITNILTRDHEFAMLQSVGMTRKQLAAMLRTEGLILSAGNLLITLVIGTGAGYLMIWLLRYFGAEYMHFVFPVWFFLGYAVFIVLVPVLITEYMVRRFQRQTLVERLREE